MSCAVYDIRCNADNQNQNPEAIKTKLRALAKKWTFQLERGEETGYLHYQGRISLFKKCLPSKAHQLFDTFTMNYIEPTSKAGRDSFYVLKEQTRVEGPWKDTDPDIFIPIQYQNIQFHDYQQEIYDNKDINHRQINLVFDPKGNNGKTTIGALSSIKKGYIYLPFINDYEDLMATMLCKCYDVTRDPKVVLLDMPRALGKDRLGQIYAGLETIKGGYLFDKRYHFKEWWINAPSIYVFSNKMPDLKYLSLDRWRFLKITKSKKFTEFNPADYSDN